MLVPLRVLILDDNPQDSEFVVRELQRAGFAPDWHRVDTESDYLAHLRTDLDIIVADYSMPSFSAPRALDLLHEHGLDIPFIVVTGSVTELVVAETLQKGAADYLLKDRLTRLGQAVTHALEEKRLRVEKARAETALRESEARFRRLAENAPDIIFRYRVAPDSAFEYVNPAITSITDYTPAECYANPGLLFDLIHEDDEPLLQQLLDSTRDPRQSVVIRWLHKNGTIIWTEQRVVLVHDAEGQLVAIEGIVRDITERKRTEEERLKTELLLAKLEKEKELVDLKERFISMTTHEFRTPLTVIMLAVGLLETRLDTLTGQKRLDTIRNIHTQAQYMNHLLDDVLAFSKARAGVSEFNPVALDLALFCRDILEQFQNINQMGHHLVFRTDGDLAAVAVDQHLVRHILVNLLSNAIKYSPQGGEVSLDVERKDDEIRLRIRDHGIGIPPADQVRLFEPFHRAKNALKIDGTGLGLAIVKTSVEAHGGTIAVESTEGDGTTFTVRVPISLQPQNNLQPQNRT